MNRWRDLIDQFWFVLPFAFWAGVGFMAHTLQAGWPGWRVWLSQLVTAFVAGATVGMLLQDVGISEFALYGICSCVGMSGGKIVEDLAKWARRRAEKVIAGDLKPQLHDGDEDGED